MKNISNALISNITYSITSSLDIAEGLKETKRTLSACLPVDKLILFRVDDADGRLRTLLHIADADRIDERELSSFLSAERKTISVKDSSLSPHSRMRVYTRLALEQEVDIQCLRDYISQLCLSPDTDLLILFDQGLHVGIIILSYAGNKFDEAHARLMEQLRAPFHSAMRNALLYYGATRKRDELIHENMLFREATIRLTGDTNMADAFYTTLEFLRDTVALRQIILVSVEDGSLERRVMLRVKADGTKEEFPELLKLGTSVSPKEKNVRQRLLENLPEVFVTNILHIDKQHNLHVKNLDDQLAAWGIRSESTVIVLWVKAIRSGVLFSFSPSQSPDRCLRIIHSLKEPFYISLHNAIRFYDLQEHQRRLMEEKQELLTDLQRDIGEQVVGMDNGLQYVMTLAAQVAKKPSPVLLFGETGTGKEVIATTIHRISERRAGPFISINCGAIPETLMDSELFGHEKGAFTGANERKRGRFERAEGGTLFLDEVGELPLSAQVKLLRVLQEKEFERVGGSHPIHVNVRLIAATNRDLPEMIRKGTFRKDLWFRLNVFPIRIPPLRERTQDIPALAYFFIETKVRQLNLPFRPRLVANELQKLMRYNWPGNVRELQNTIERALILCKGEPLHFPLLGETVAHSVSEKPAALEVDAASRKPVTFEESNRVYFEQLLKYTGGRISGRGGAAELSGLHPSTLRSKLKKLDCR